MKISFPARAIGYYKKGKEKREFCFWGRLLREEMLFGIDLGYRWKFIKANRLAHPNISEDVIKFEELLRIA